ncbi:MAG: DUF3373 family protein [Campylobacterales bacterium]
MKKAFLLSAVAATALMAADADLEQLKQEVESLKNQLIEVKKSTAQDNIKFSVDYRAAIDNISYTMADGSKAENPDLMTNRLWLNMKYQPKSNLAFFGQLANYKAYGDSVNHGQTNTQPGYGNFDWVVNENPGDGAIRVRQAYFLYTGALGDMTYTASFGRRPSTGGGPTHYREDDHAQSPLGHMVNVEFDGASFQFNLNKVADVPGMYVKLCLGRGLSNAKPRFQMDGTDFAKDDTASHTGNIDMAGFIFQPYYNGQYRVVTQFIRGMNLIGYTGTTMGAYQTAYGNYMANPTGANWAELMNAQPRFSDFGAVNGATITYQQEGVGEFINDFLDNTKLFASFSMSQTDPESGMAMLGSTDKKTGTSWYVGAQIPAMFTQKGKLGFEYNQGSKYWRSFTYGEDTLIGSKLAARGNAMEVYYTQPLVDDILSFQLRYTSISYDYTGSNSFFGDDGRPTKISDVPANQQSMVVEKASDIRAYLRYRY